MLAQVGLSGATFRSTKRRVGKQLSQPHRLSSSGAAVTSHKDTLHSSSCSCVRVGLAMHIESYFFREVASLSCACHDLFCQSIVKFPTVCIASFPFRRTQRASEGHRHDYIKSSPFKDHSNHKPFTKPSADASSPSVFQCRSPWNSDRRRFMALSANKRSRKSSSLSAATWLNNVLSVANTALRSKTEEKANKPGSRLCISTATRGWDP